MNSKYSIDFGSYFDKAPVVEEQPKQTGIVAPRTKDIKAPTDDGYKPDAFVSDYMKILAEYAGGEDKARELLGRTASTYDPMATLDKYGEPFDMAQAAQDDAFKWSAARDAAGITQSLPTPGFEMRIGEAGVLPGVPDVDTAELPARVAPVGREDMLKGAGLASPMGGPNRGSVRPAAEETPDISTSVEAAVAEALGGTEEAITGEGLMSRRLDSKGSAMPKTELSRYTDDFAEVYLKEHEGLKSHKSLEGGKDTAALGVKFSLGLKRSNYKSDAEFAGAVALKHRDKAKAKFGKAKWDKLPESVKFAMTDLNYNTGTIGSSGSKKDTTTAMKNTLDFVGMTTKAGDKASLISLAKRRAWNWNKAASDIGESKIAKIKQIPTTNGGTKFEYLDKDGGVVHSTTTSRTPVKLDNAGVATTLTSTREIDM